MGEIGRTARLIGCTTSRRRYAQVAAGDFVTYLARMLAAQGEEVSVDASGAVLRQQGWRLMRGVSFGHPAAKYSRARGMERAVARRAAGI
jgi:hypothetical protein